MKVFWGILGAIIIIASAAFGIPYSTISDRSAKYYDYEHDFALYALQQADKADKSGLRYHSPQQAGHRKHLWH
jgi:hypothetical protein